jgi:hypothetical protein
MLYNPTWDKSPSISGFMLWLESKDPNESYRWESCEVCAIGQYMREIGSDISPISWRRYLGDANAIAQQFPHTFGALSERMKEYIS